MVEERITDGKRIAQLLASELEGREDGGLERIAVTDADRDVEPTADGARAYDVSVLSRDEATTPEDDVDVGDDASGDDGDGESDETVRIARVFVHENRARLEFAVGQDIAAQTAEEGDLRVRPKATEPPRTLVFVESGAAVKRATNVVQSVVARVQSTE
ncbi:hypothetical protein [Natrialba swarupiae]|uniref:DUF7993 domain-containing protein n=1 Tax=Natrialba swarupiae TaxID=2448032 RepID=A0A5D5ANJ5_9EURY|nr:hypothetical protein [Natrialba swarupiae]TYT61312.1 hypothetical protein FYC77_13950 [Natrialba swarupiae]